MPEASLQRQPASIQDAANRFGPLAEIDFQRVFSVLWRGKTTILWTTAAALLLAVLFVLIVPPRYTATTQIVIDPTDLRALPHELTQANQGGDMALLQVESQLRVLTSDKVLRRVITATSLDTDPEFLRNWTGGIDSSLVALNALKRVLVVKRADRTYVVDVSVTAREPAKAARIANAVVQAYLAEQTDVRSDAARQISQSLSARLNELKDRVRSAEDRAEAFKAQNKIIEAKGELVGEQQLSELVKQLGLARAQTVAAKARLDQIQQFQDGDELGAFPDALQSGTITSLRSQYADVVRRAAQQTAFLGPRHPALIEIQAEAERLRKAIADEVHRVALAAKTEYESARTMEESLARTLEQLKGDAISTNQAMVTLRELERDVQANRAIYEAFLVRARETAEQERLDTKNIRVITPADLPLYRSFPPSNVLLALSALFLGVATGTGIILMREYGGGLQSDSLTGSLRSRFANGKRGLWSGSSFSPSVPVLAVLPNLGIAFRSPAAGIANSRLRTELHKIHQQLRASRRPRRSSSVLVVGSSGEQETVLVALALATVAAARQSVLLIDTDLSCRTLSALDADRAEGGLVDVAVGRRRLSEVIVRDPETKINLISFVSPNSRRDHRIREEEVREALSQTTRFDLVIAAAIDMTPTPSTSFFAAIVDQIVLVARAEEQASDAVTRFISHLGRDARKVRGAILTLSKQA